MVAETQVEYLLRFIRNAFEGVQLGGGVSIRQTPVIDMYGNEEEMAEARRQDQVCDWESLIDDPVFDEISGIGGVCFLDDDGLRFYTPVYMTMLIKDPKLCPHECETLLSILTEKRRKKPHQKLLFSRLQIHCLRQCFKFLRHNTGTILMMYWGQLDRAIEEWIKGEPQ